MQNYNEFIESASGCAKPALVILDEPSASLDAEAEFDLFNELIQYGSERINVLISHRFSTVRAADLVLVLEYGKCIESGSHKELMNLSGQYHYLFNLQSRGYQDTTIGAPSMRKTAHSVYSRESFD
ncbi:MAG: hypothetical protein HY741_11705 [Chloroflexi bacterium]|nr:hypothetical protein [Chloroflexota bacterium]